MSSKIPTHIYPDLYPVADAAVVNPELFLRRQLFLLWLFAAQEGILDDAKDFVLDHINDPLPFELFA